MTEKKLTPKERFELRMSGELTPKERAAVLNQKYPFRTKPHATRMADMMLYLQYSLGHTSAPLSYITALFIIADKAPLNMTQLAESLGLVRTTITRMVDALSTGMQEYSRHIMGQGYIRVIPDPLDNRTKLLELTPAGQHLIEFSNFILAGGASFEELLTAQPQVIDALSKE